MTGFKREKLHAKFDVKIITRDEEERKLLDEAEDLVYKYYIDSSFFQGGNETKPLVVALYKLGMEYVKLRRLYAMQQARMERLLKELRSLHE